MQAGADWTHARLRLTGTGGCTGILHFCYRPYADVQLSVRQASKLQNKDGMFGTSDPFAVVAGLLPPKGARGEGGTWGRTAVVDDNLDPVWDSSAFPIRLLDHMSPPACGGGKLEPLTVQLFDFDTKGSHDALGSATVPWAVLFPPPAQLRLIRKYNRPNEVRLAITGSSSQCMLLHFATLRQITSYCVVPHPHI